MSLIPDQGCAPCAANQNYNDQSAQPISGCPYAILDERPTDCFDQQGYCLVFVPRERCFYVWLGECNGGWVRADCNPRHYAIQQGDNVSIEECYDAYGNLTWKISVKVPKYKFITSGIISASPLEPDPVTCEQVVHLHVPPTVIPEAEDPCDAPGVETCSPLDTRLICRDGCLKQISEFDTNAILPYASVEEGMANTCPGQLFCVGCYTFANTDGTKPHLLSSTHEMPMNLGFIASHNFQNGHPIETQPIRELICMADYDIPPCVNKIQLKIEITFCHRLKGDFDDQNVTWSLSGSGVGTGHFNRSARICSQSVRDLSDNAPDTAWVGLDENQCITLESNFKGDVPGVYEKNHPEDAANVRYKVIGIGTWIDDPDLWQYVEK